MKKFVEKDVAENPLYHDTWKLLKKYRDVVWSLEISVQHVRSKFEIEYGTSIEEFLDSIYAAGADLGDSQIKEWAKSIARSNETFGFSSRIASYPPQERRGLLLAALLLLPLPAATQKCGGDHREFASAYPGHLIPYLLPQAQGSH